MNVKFHKNCDYIGKIRWNFVKFDIHFLALGSHKKFFLVLLRMIYYIFSPWKV